MRGGGGGCSAGEMRQLRCHVIWKRIREELWDGPANAESASAGFESGRMTLDMGGTWQFEGGGR